MKDARTKSEQEESVCGMGQSKFVNPAVMKDVIRKSRKEEYVGVMVRSRPVKNKIQAERMHRE